MTRLHWSSSSNLCLRSNFSGTASITMSADRKWRFHTSLSSVSGTTRDSKVSIYAKAWPFRGAHRQAKRGKKKLIAGSRKANGDSRPWRYSNESGGWGRPGKDKQSIRSVGLRGKGKGLGPSTANGVAYLHVIRSRRACASFCRALVHIRVSILSGEVGLGERRERRGRRGGMRAFETRQGDRVYLMLGHALLLEFGGGVVHDVRGPLANGGRVPN